MASQASLRTRIRSLVYGIKGMERPFEDRINEGAQLSAADTTVTVLSDGTSWNEGDMMEFENGEQAVVSAAPTGSNVPVRRGVNGTTATTHENLEAILKSPRFSVQQIDGAIDQVLQDLYPWVYLVTELSDTFDPTQYWYPIANDNVREVLTVYYVDPTYAFPQPLTGWRFNSGLNATDFTATQGLFIPHGEQMLLAETFYIVVKEVLDNVTDLTASQEHLVAVGSVYILLGGETVSRTHDPGKRTDRTVQPGQDARDSIWFLREFIRLRQTEWVRLAEVVDRLPISRLQARAQRFRR